MPDWPPIQPKPFTAAARRQRIPRHQIWAAYQWVQQQERAGHGFYSVGHAVNSWLIHHIQKQPPAPKG